MANKRRRNQDSCWLQISVPFTPHERKRFEGFIAKRGLKKGILVKIALLEHIEKAEAVSPS